MQNPQLGDVQNGEAVTLRRDGDFGTSEEDDTDDGTDDDASAGQDKTGSLLWRHIEFFIARNRRPEDHKLLFAKVTIVHTKGEGNRPRE